jgi:hypothetical protein
MLNATFNNISITVLWTVKVLFFVWGMSGGIAKIDDF